MAVKVSVRFSSVSDENRTKRTSIWSCGTDILISQPDELGVQPLVFGKLLTGTQLRNRFDLGHLLVQPGKEPDHRGTVSQVGVPESLDLGFRFERLGVVAIRRSEDVSSGAEHEGDDVWGFGFDEDLIGKKS